MPGRKSAPSSTKVSSSEPKELHCICRQPEEGRFMICCDECDIWFHGDCVNLTTEDAKKLIGEWYCPSCFVKRARKSRRMDTSSYSSPQTPQRMPVVARMSTSATVPKNSAEPSWRNWIAPFRASEKNDCMICKVKPARQGSRVCSDACVTWQEEKCNHMNQSL